MPDQRATVPFRLLAVLASGTVLNPLNSSMIAVALLPLRHEFGLGVAEATWVVSAFYLAAAVGQPLAGRLADLLGARRLFVGGLVLVLVASLAAPFSPGFWWLVGARVLLAAGTSTAFPAALVLIRAAASTVAPPARALATLSVAASTSAALGPVLGGLLVAFAGWQAVFVVNVPITLVGMTFALRTLPRVEPDARARRSFRATADLTGVVLFTGTLTTLLMFLLSLADGALWWLALVVVALGVLLVAHERRTAAPFLDVRGLTANPGLVAVVAHQGGVNLAFYCVFFGLPLWLGAVRGLDADTVGLLVLPIALMGVLTTPVAAWVVGRHGSRTTLVAGAVVLVGATLLLQVLSVETPVIALVAVALLLGIPGGFTNLGLQSALYEVSPPERTGSSGGLFQTFRYLGAISATSVLGLTLDNDLSTRGIHRVGLVTTVVAIALVALSLARGRGAYAQRAPGTS